MSCAHYVVIHSSSASTTHFYGVWHITLYSTIYQSYGRIFGLSWIQLLPNVEFTFWAKNLYYGQTIYLMNKKTTWQLIRTHLPHLSLTGWRSVGIVGEATAASGWEWLLLVLSCSSSRCHGHVWRSLVVGRDSPLNRIRRVEEGRNPSSALTVT